MPTTSSGQLPPGAGTSIRSPIASFRRRASCSLTRPASPGRRRIHASSRRFQQRPVVAIGRVIGEAQHLDRHAAELRVGPAAGQHGANFRPIAQPCLDLVRLRVVGGDDIDIRGQPSVEPDQEGAAKTLHHGADADIDREREQQRHQGERQSGKLLAAVGPEPNAERVRGTALADREHDLENHRQDQRGAKQSALRAPRSLTAGNRRTTRKPRRGGKYRACATALWNMSQRCCACCQACGCAEASTGIRIALVRLAAAAASAPRMLMAMPASHHSPLSVNCPGICAP